MVLILFKLLLRLPDVPNVWTVVLFGIRSLVYLPLVLVSLPINQRIVGVVVGGVMLIEGGFNLAGAFVLSLGLYRLFRGLRCVGYLGSAIFWCYAFGS